jgi:hypothetical protein
MYPVRRIIGIVLPFLAAAAAQPLAAKEAGPAATVRPANVTYADLADLADSARLVLRAQIRKIARVEDARVAGLRPGWGRFYVRAQTRVLLTGTAPLGETLTYLVDLPLDPRGQPPEIKQSEVLVFARPVTGRPGELRLVAPDAQLPWSVELEARLRPILAELAAGNKPAPVTGLRELIHVPGTLAGQGETQIFLETSDDSAASITVRHAPGAGPVWSVSFSELIAEAGSPPQRSTLAWYRLACFLPARPAPAANLSETAEGRTQAEADYRMVLGELGPCPRNRR